MTDRPAAPLAPVPKPAPRPAARPPAPEPVDWSQESTAGEEDPGASVDPGEAVRRTEKPA